MPLVSCFTSCMFSSLVALFIPIGSCIAIMLNTDQFCVAIHILVTLLFHTALGYLVYYQSMHRGVMVIGQ